jgi:hypothetical protein
LRASTPSGFLQVNRALLALTSIAPPFACATCYDDALTPGRSFVDKPRRSILARRFRANAGDATNGLSQPVSSAVNLVHRSLRDVWL